MINRIQFFCGIILCCWLSPAHTTDLLGKEFDHYLATGMQSTDFIKNMSHAASPVDSQSLENLDTLELKLPRSAKCVAVISLHPELKKVLTGWSELAVSEGQDLRWQVLCLNKCLSLYWTERIAIQVANLCHQMTKAEDASPEFKMRVAYRGFDSLRIRLKEPGFNLHARPVSVQPTIQLLEVLKPLTAQMQTPEELPFFWRYGPIFSEYCIPSAALARLLVVAHGGRFLVSERNAADIHSTQFAYAKECVAGYMSGLETTPSQSHRRFYLIQICRTISDLYVRVPKLVLKEYPTLREQFITHGLQLAEIQIGELTEIDCDRKPAQWCQQSYDIGISLTVAQQYDRARTYFQQVLDFETKPDCLSTPFISTLKFQTQHQIKLQADSNL
jgi:hypothetical protein